MAANTGKADPRLAVNWPALGRPIWEAFLQLGRPASMDGIQRISCQEIDAYQRVNGITFTAWERSTIAMFDSIAIEIANEKKGPGQ